VPHLANFRSRASVSGRGDSRERPDLGIGQLAAGERLADARQVRQRARHANALVGGAPVHADTPGQPVRARLEAIGPAAAGVEVSDHVEQAGSGDFDVGREHGDLVAQALEGLDLRIRYWR